MRRTIRGDVLELPIVDEQFVACGDEHFVTVESDAAQPAIPAPALPVDVRGVPVHGFGNPIFFYIDQVDTTVTFALTGAADNRCGDEYGH